MRFLLITVEYPPDKGGISTYIRNEVEEFRRAGEEVWVVAEPVNPDDFKKPSPYASAMLQKQQNAKIEELKKIEEDKYLKRTPFYYSWIRPRWLKLFFKVFSDVKKGDYDYLITHHVLPVGQVCYLMKKIKKIPYVLHIHGLDVMMGKQSRWKRWWMKRIIAEAEFVVANSKFAQSAFDGFPAKKTVIVYPCPNRNLMEVQVNPDMLANLRSQYVLGNRKVLLSVARLVERKGLQTIAEALPDIIGQDPDVVWCIVGVGDYSEELGKIIGKHSTQYATRFIGGQDWVSLAAWFSLCEVFAMPSIAIPLPKGGVDVEGWGIVFTEAAYFGKPTIAGRAGGSPEAIVDGQTGILVDGNSVDEVKAAIMKLMSDENLRKQYGEAGKKRIDTEFRWDVQMKKVIDEVRAHAATKKK